MDRSSLVSTFLYRSYKQRREPMHFLSLQFVKRPARCQTATPMFES